MQIDEGDKAQAKPAEGAEATDGTKDGAKDTGVEGEKEGGKEAAAPKEPEPSSHSLDNPARVVPAQEKLVKFPEGSRYTPIRPGRTAGILLLKDSTPGACHTASLFAARLAQSTSLLVEQSCCSAAALFATVVALQQSYSLTWQICFEASVFDVCEHVRSSHQICCL